MFVLSKVDAYPFSTNPGEGTGVAYVSVVLNEDLVLSSMVLHKAADGGFRLASPGSKAKRREGEEEGKWHDFYFFMKRETRQQVLDAAIEAYQKKVGAS